MTGLRFWKWFRKPLPPIEEPSKLTLEEASKLMEDRGFHDSQWHASPNVLLKDNEHYMRGFDRGQSELVGEGVEEVPGFPGATPTENPQIGDTASGG